MRSTDIHIEWTDSRDRTENLYLPSQVPVEEMSMTQARRGLCARAMGSTTACRSGCGAGCRFGRRVMELEDAGATGEASPREQRKQLPVPEQTKRAEPPTRQQAAPVKTARRERPREEKWRYQAGLALLMDANFGRNDLHVTLTYRGTPPDYEQARKDVRNYLRAVKRMREKAGLPEMKYIYVIEEEGGDGEKRRIHVHLMMTGGISREALEEKWGRGYANCDRLQPEEGTGLLELARYFTKQGMEKHRRAWSAKTRSCGRRWKNGRNHADREPGQ